MVCEMYSTLIVSLTNLSVTILSRKPKSTNPLIVSLALDLFARYLRRSTVPSAALERNEYGRRDRDLVWYLLRGSIWESYTRYVSECVLGWLGSGSDNLEK